MQIYAESCWNSEIMECIYYWNIHILATVTCTHLSGICIETRITWRRWPLHEDVAQNLKYYTFLFGGVRLVMKVIAYCMHYWYSVVIACMIDIQLWYDQVLFFFAATFTLVLGPTQSHICLLLVALSVKDKNSQSTILTTHLHMSRVLKLRLQGI